MEKLYTAAQVVEYKKIHGETYFKWLPSEVELIKYAIAHMWTYILYDVSDETEKFRNFMYDRYTVSPEESLKAAKIALGLGRKKWDYVMGGNDLPDLEKYSTERMYYVADLPKAAVSSKMTDRERDNLKKALNLQEPKVIPELKGRSSL